MSASIPGRSRWQAALLAFLFVAPAGGAWAWFHISPRAYAVRYQFVPKGAIPGHRFVPETVGEAAVETLATTNLINGSFVSDLGERVTVFMGDWRDKTARQMSVIQHTPDICWVGVGWTPVSKGQPDRIEITLDGIRLPFECRIFRSPTGREEELTVWCALANGQVFEEGGRFSGGTSSTSERESSLGESNRRRALTSFLNAVRQRIPAEGSKQFVRFSTAVGSDWRIAAAELKVFAPKWLGLNVIRNQDGAGEAQMIP